MSGTRARRVTRLLLAVLEGLAPRGLRIWAEAIRAEAAQIASDREALRFVAASAPGLLMIFARASIGVVLRDAPGGPRALAVLAATGAVGLGCVHMIGAGAPAAMLVMNGSALVLGILLLVAMARWLPPSRDCAEIAMVGIAAALLGTSLFGVAADGAMRWVDLGPLTIQPSLILLPLLLMIFARTPTATGGLAVAIAALAIALQPDRAMAGTMVAALAVLRTARGEWPVSVALAASASGFLVTLARPDGLPGGPHSDGIFSTAWQVHPALGLAVWFGAALLLLPCGMRGAGEARGEGVSRTVFGITWLCVTVAAVPGTYPAPLVGYGGSAILGYLLAASLLPAVRPRPQGGSADRQPRDSGTSDRLPRFPDAVSCA